MQVDVYILLKNAEGIEGKWVYIEALDIHYPDTRRKWLKNDESRNKKK
jgi:hypothetical protein